MDVRSDTGAEIVRDWAATLPPGANVLDLGAGSGWPITTALVEAGLAVSAVEPAPALADAFARNLPDVPLERATVRDSVYLNRAYDGISAIGLLFLLSPKRQVALLHRMADALRPGGSVLFSAPRETGAWRDVLTRRLSVSLGFAAYRTALETNGLALSALSVDAGGSHYYWARKV